MRITILPRPREAQLQDGSFTFGRQPCMLSPQAAAHPAIAWKMRDLKLRPTELTADRPVFAMGRPSQIPDAPTQAEGYTLVIEPAGVAIAGRDLDGLYWGLTTLQQLMLNGGELPGVTIRDWPQVAVRYHHDDISRKQVSTVEDFKQIIHRLSMLKVNHYTPYIEDMLHLPSFPDIGEGRGKLSADEVRQIIDEGRRYNVTVFPTFSLIGHQENLLSLPKYRPLAREVWHSPSSFDPDKPAVREFLTSAIRDVCEIFPGQLFHMGFDETQGLDRDAYFRHANWCAGELRKYGRRPMMWVDMVYNHFGYESLKDLDPSIIAINWTYADTREKVKHQSELLAQDREVWGLAGYSTWTTFLPDPANCRRNMEGWMSEIARNPIGGFGASIWGDNGYENHRALAQNQYATFAEYAWSGPAADIDTFDARFERLFYGAELPQLRRITVDLPAKLSIPPRTIWQWFRRNANAMRRHAATNPKAAAALARDARMLEAAMADLSAARKSAKRNADHLNLVESAIQRTQSTIQRLRYAFKPSPAAARSIVGTLRQAREDYRAAWLRHNKPENIEVSLGVFDIAIAEYSQLARRPARVPAPGGPALQPLPFRPNARHSDIGGIPIGPAAIDGVPFIFADAKSTHFKFDTVGQELALTFKPTAVRNMHLIIAGQRPKDGKPAPMLRLELLRKGAVVFSEDLLSAKHLCDWWAPFGEHMWAGGGLKYVDPMRVSPALRPDPFLGLMRLHNFGLVGTPTADRLRLISLSDTGVHLFAVTLEKPAR